MQHSRRNWAGTNVIVEICSLQKERIFFEAWICGVHLSNLFQVYFLGLSGTKTKPRSDMQVRVMNSYWTGALQRPCWMFLPQAQTFLHRIDAFFFLAARSAIGLCVGFDATPATPASGEESERPDWFGTVNASVRHCGLWLIDGILLIDRLGPQSLRGSSVVRGSASEDCSR